MIFLQANYCLKYAFYLRSIFTGLIGFARLSPGDIYGVSTTEANVYSTENVLKFIKAVSGTVLGKPLLFIGTTF